ncbi:3' terminal RNA ribose 2'-O-methyltransferase Hen1 [Amycolatopsis arida]|uniref:Small RNA 2'-O-methyltransferase n=1 Tax=Amycolatopsis arida TaxID=587909 RepID=A0A1I5PUL0_9PSEU|nr:3' terminal RNA ribose 2'-O-methyltransferase Hen1 [Amycolatopsis arida]TDX98607.1 3' terminal RNA ribose 2'-O-methyltransferase Hen1 [Amycolatopsis arida]SFP37597.1 3' terminal RNA ribose 2'-O-methyltransferase Hen1 [Amycolatopsis arida]
MLLTITTTREPATDLGFLLHKHPDNTRSVELPAGVAHVFFPEATPRRCTAALLVEVDPVALARAERGAGQRGPGQRWWGQYVSSRPYAAGSLLAVALRTVFSTARAGRCAARPELAGTPLPLELDVPATPGDPDLARRLFAPLGWRVEAIPVPLDEHVPEWGAARLVRLRLAGEQRLADALNHLYVLLPVLDGDKHYWVGEDEVDKLLRAGGAWLPDHPERELVTNTYLAHRGHLVDTALSRLAEAGDPDPVAEPAVGEESETPLRVRRQEAVLAALREAGARRVVDLGCGAGALLRSLLRDPMFTEVVGVDVAPRALELAERRLDVDRLPDSVRARLRLRQSALTYVDPALAGYDAAVLMEVIEHVDEPRLPALEHAVFGAVRPDTVVVTTPNAEYNVRFPGLAGFRHEDHRFEWDRARFAEWARGVAEAHGYRVAFRPVGPVDPEVGPPTQLAIFSRETTAAREVTP